MLSRETGRERERAICIHQSDQKESASSGSQEVSGYRSKVVKYGQHSELKSSRTQ